MYYGFVVETEHDFYAVKLWRDSREAAEKAINYDPPFKKLHFIGECDLVQDESDSLYDKACKKADALRSKNKATPGCTAKTGSLF